MAYDVPIADLVMLFLITCGKHSRRLDLQNFVISDMKPNVVTSSECLSSLKFRYWSFKSSMSDTYLAALYIFDLTMLVSWQIVSSSVLTVSAETNTMSGLREKNTLLIGLNDSSGKSTNA